MTDRNKIDEELFLYLGQAGLPEGLEAKVRENEEYRQLWQELQAIGRQLGDDDKFLPDNLNAEEFMADLNRRLDRRERPAGTPDRALIRIPGFYKWVGVAAMFVLVAGVSLLGLFFDRNDEEFSSLTIDNRTVAYYFGFEDDFVVEAFDSTLALGGHEFQVLVEGYTSRQPYRSLEGVLDDISEEEFEYLQKNFDVGDLL